MNERHRETHAWLEKVLGEDLPQYELNQQTVGILHDLMVQNEKQDECASVVMADMQRKAEEYKLEAERLGLILQRLGLLPCVLSQSGMTSLLTLSKTSILLQTRDASPTSLLLAIGDHCKRKLKLDRLRRMEKQTAAHLKQRTEEIEHKCIILKRTLDRVEEEVKQQQPDLMKKAQKAAFLQRKSREYRKKIGELKHQLASTGADPTIYHSALVKKSEELDELRCKLQPLRSKLDSYHQLPPDAALARVKLEEGKLLLASLEEQLSRHIDLLHM